MIFRNNDAGDLPSGKLEGSLILQLDGEAFG